MKGIFTGTGKYTNIREKQANSQLTFGIFIWQDFTCDG